MSKSNFLRDRRAHGNLEFTPGKTVVEESKILLVGVHFNTTQRRSEINQSEQSSSKKTRYPAPHPILILTVGLTK